MPVYVAVKAVKCQGAKQCLTPARSWINKDWYKQVGYIIHVPAIGGKAMAYRTVN